MEAKDKAKALVEKYFEELFEYIPNIADRMKAAKQCALIACAEVKENGFNPQLPYNFWEDVEKEINQL